MDYFCIIILSFISTVTGKGQVSVSSSAAASVKYPPPGQGPPHAYISSLSSAKADPKINVSIIGTANGAGTIKPPPTEPPPAPTTPKPPPQWGYQPAEGVIGPANWHTIAPQCAGKLQSPIDLNMDVTVDKSLDSPLLLNMPGVDPTVAKLFIVQGKLINNGKAIGYNIDTAATPLKLTGGLLAANVYTLKQFHFHFGCEGEMGSEHTVDGERFPGEIHLVFTNDKFPDSKTAMQQPDGLAILAFFMKVNKEKEGANKALERISANIDAVKEPKQQIVFPDGISLVNMIPLLSVGAGNLRRFAYKGSLPTPPCFETVTWIIFRKAIEIGPLRLQKWRELQGESGGHICNNYRPIQPLNERNIFFFHPDAPKATTVPAAGPTAAAASPTAAAAAPTAAGPTAAADAGGASAAPTAAAAAPTTAAPPTTGSMQAFFGNKPGGRANYGPKVGRVSGFGQNNLVHGTRNEVKTKEVNPVANQEVIPNADSNPQFNLLNNVNPQEQNAAGAGLIKNLKEVPLINQKIAIPVISEKAQESMKLAAPTARPTARPTVAPGMKRGGTS